MTDLTVLAIPAFLALLALEYFAASRAGWNIQETRDTATSLSLGVGSVVIGAGWKAGVAGLYLGVHELTPFALADGAWAFVAALLVVDFAYYWFHRLHHEVRVL
ncbi:MAG: sterol desaturase family protein, partial [Myxococcota bacterium]